MKTLFVIGAHPDDIEFGASFAIMKYVQEGYDVYSILLTDGEKGGDSSLRIRESEEAAKVLGIRDIYRMKFPDADLPKDYELISALEPFYYKNFPEVVITHSPNDRHQDHVNASNASKIAFRKTPIILMYRSVSGTVDFKPHLFYTGDEGDLEKKIRACSCHCSQMNKGIIYVEMIRANAVFWGSLSNPYQRNYAEPFEINHFCMSLKHKGGV